MIKLPYDKNRDYDVGVDNIIWSSVERWITKGDDDYMVLCVGNKGTGKSRLMLHFMEKYLGAEADVKYLGLKKGDFITALYHAKNRPLPRFCGNDEANIGKRDAMTRYVKEINDTYMAIRGLNIFHFWCNPSLDMMDKPIIEEIGVKGVIYIPRKTPVLRYYFYFTKKAILQILEKYKNLKLETIHKVRKEYAYYRGWFKDYNGFLLKPYLDKKSRRMNEKIDAMYSKYGLQEDMITTAEMARKLNIHYTTLDRHADKALSEGLLKENQVIITGAGRRVYSPECIKIFQEIGRRKYEKKI